MIDARLSANVPLLNATNVFSQGQRISNADPFINVYETDAAGDEKSWLWRSSGGSFALSAATDAAPTTAANNAIVITRSTTTVTGIALTASAITLNGVSATDFARLSVASNDFNSAVAGGKQIAITNTNSGTTSYAFQTLVNDAGRSLQFIRTSSGWSGTWLTGGPSGEQSGLNSSGAFPLTIGVNGTERIRITSAGVITFNGVDAADFARLSQSNTFTGATQTINAASALLKVTDGTREVRLNAEATKGSIGTFSNHPFAIFTNNSTVLSLDSAGTLAGSTIAGVAFSDFARLSQAVAFAATVTAATGLIISANGATITGNSTITGTLGGLTGLTVASGGVNITGTVTTPNTSANEVGYKGLPQNSQSVSYTTVLADCNKNLHQTGATKTFTIDSNANVAAPIGTVLNFTCDNATGVSIAITTDTLRLAGTATTGTRTLAQYGVASAIKILSTTWLISGQGLS